MKGVPRFRRTMMGGPIEVSPVLRLHALTRGLSRFAAPFFSAQAEPSSRRRSMSGLLAVSVWRFGESLAFWFFACAWCHLERLGSFTSSLLIVVMGVASVLNGLT
jgi:hypothetical protein